jgi:hypothetical protein
MRQDALASEVRCEALGAYMSRGDVGKLFARITEGGLIMASVWRIARVARPVYAVHGPNYCAAIVPCSCPPMAEQTAAPSARQVQRQRKAMHIIASKSFYGGSTV